SNIFDYRVALGRVAAKMEGKMAEGSSSLKECSSLEKQEESEGRRMESFRKVMRKCLDKIMATGSQEKFSSCFTSIREKNPVEFRSITEQLMQHLQNNIETFTRFLCLIHRRPSGNPDKDICDHIMQVKLAYKEQLTHILHELESNNEKLNGEVLPKREKLIETEKQLNEKTKDLREAAKYCKENSVQELHDQCVMLSQK
ncbi:unnamed protein product, partial [Porites evermanni]